MAARGRGVARGGAPNRPRLALWSNPRVLLFRNLWTTDVKHIKLHNAGLQKAHVCIKCSDPRLYRVRPAHGTVDVDGTLQLLVVRRPGPPRQEHLLIEYTAEGPVAITTDSRELRVLLVSIERDPIDRNW